MDNLLRLFYVYESSHKNQARSLHLGGGDQDKPEYFYTEEELLSLRFISESTKKKIQKAKPGTGIKISKWSADKDLCVALLSQAEVELIDEIFATKNDIEVVNQDIEDTIPDLLENKRQLENDLKKKRDKLQVKFYLV